MGIKSLFGKFDINNKKDMVCIQLDTPEDHYLCFIRTEFIEDLKAKKSKALYHFFEVSDYILENGILIKNRG